MNVDGPSTFHVLVKAKYRKMETENYPWMEKLHPEADRDDPKAATVPPVPALPAGRQAAQGFRVRWHWDNVPGYARGTDFKSVPLLWRLGRCHLTRRRVDTAHWTTSSHRRCTAPRGFTQRVHHERAQPVRVPSSGPPLSGRWVASRPCRETRGGAPPLKIFRPV